MTIKGDVRSLSLANVLQDLAMNEQTGMLRIQQKDRRLNLWFEKGVLRLVGFGRGDGPSPVNGLLALGKISYGELPPANARRSEANFVRQLAKKGRIARSDIQAALEQQMMEHVCDAFLWTEANFEFHEGDPEDDSFDVDQIEHEPKLGVDGLIMEALRRQDEWGETRKAILTSNEILVVDPARITEADAVTKRVASLFDGERRLVDIMDYTRLGQFTVFKIAAALLKSGAARPVSPAEAYDRARKRASGGDWNAALRLALYGLDHERNNPPLRRLAAECYEALEDREQAVAQYRLLATAQIEAEKHEEALATYQKITTLAPKDTYAHERIFDLYILLGRKAEALTAGEALTASYKRAGLPEKAREVYARLIESFGEEEALVESLAEIARHLGDKKEAVELYRKLLGKALSRKENPAALDLCRTILRLDPAHEEVQQIRQELESGAIEKRRRRRRRVKILIVLGVLLAVAATAGVYEFQARQRFAQRRQQILEYREAKNYSAALACYDDVMDTYPWSLTTRELRPERELLEEKFFNEEIQRSRDLAERDQLIDALRVLEESRHLARKAEIKSAVEGALADLQKRRTSKETQFRTEIQARLRKHRAGDKSALAEIAKLTDPLAVPGLKDLLSDENVDVRRAALEALGQIVHPVAWRALLNGFTDPDPELRKLAARSLSERTSQNFGEDVKAWEKWLRQKQGGTPIQVTLTAPKEAFTGEPLVFGWRLENDGAASLDFTIRKDLAATLILKGPEVISATLSTGKVRTYSLDLNQYVGGTLELPAAKSPGLYRATWSVTVVWPDRRGEEVLEALPVTFEVKPK